MLTVISTSSELPVSLVEMKAHLRVNLDDEDDYIVGLIRAATDSCERDIGRSFTPATFEEHHARLPDDLLKSPVRSVVWIKYYDSTNTLQTWDEDHYVVVKPHNLPGRLFPLIEFPSIYDRPDAVQIRYTAGYDVASSSSSGSDDGPALPEIARHAIKLLVGHWYEHRESEGEVTQELKVGLERLLRQLDFRGYF